MTDPTATALGTVDAVTAPTPEDHSIAAVDLLTQADSQAQAGSVVAAQASVARAQVQALLAIAGHLAEANTLAAQPATTEPAPTDTTTTDTTVTEESAPDAPLPG